jgi:hypothetical protein
VGYESVVARDSCACHEVGGRPGKRRAPRRVSAHPNFHMVPRKFGSFYGAVEIKSGLSLLFPWSPENGRDQVPQLTL